MIDIDILRAARDRIADPINWQQNWYASTADGKRTMGHHGNAVCFCAYGALDSAGAAETSDEANAFEVQAAILFGVDLVKVNDDLGHEAVLQVYDAAIAAAEAEAR